MHTAASMHKKGKLNIYEKKDKIPRTTRVSKAVARDLNQTSGMIGTNLNFNALRATAED